MDWERKHKVYGTAAADYVTYICDELESDGVSASQIWSSARHGFGFNDQEVNEFAFITIKALLDAGAVPAKPSKDAPAFFSAQKGFIGDSTTIANQIVRERDNLSADPDHGWHWFYRFE